MHAKTEPAQIVDRDAARDQVTAALRRGFAVCGNQLEFVRLLNKALTAAGFPTITQQAVSWWATEGTLVDKRYWPHIEAITDMACTRRHLRPDIYGLWQP